MNEDMPQNAFSNQRESWLLDHLGEIGERQGGDLEKRDGAFREETEMLCNRSTGSSSSGTERERSRGSPHGHESDDSSAGKSGGRNGSRSSQRNQKNEEMMMVIQEMKRYLPAERGDCCGKASTLSALQYALKCVWQVQGNSQIFPTLGEPGTALYNLEELAAVTSEHASKNTDTVVVVFSLLSGQTMHVSEQAAGILNCKKRFLDTTPFAQLLAPQDVGIFYEHTSQTHLPLWNTEAQTASVYERAQVKSFFCRLRGGKDQGQERRYYPFRITPYLVNVCVSDNSEPESCCLAVAEKIHSGYEAPRIPLEKRIFTTMHSPGCVFLETDDRAVPLLGYLPQDLIGTSILMYLHPDDQPLMMAVHRKVLRFAGQAPFEHSPIRFCTQNGDYVILDTSWSSFVNPWSRKIAFIIGRHKVRTSPLNEDVFAARSRERSPVDKEVWELQGQIYKMLLQPVHSHGSSGYGSLVSNASYEHYISVASSSDSNGNGVEELPREPMTLQQVFVDINRLKHVGQQLYIESHSRRPDRSSRAPREELPRGKESAALRLPDPATGPHHHSSSRGLPTASSNDRRSPHHLLSYQQINSMDSIIRYLEGCNIPALKRKCESSASTSSSSDDDEQEGPASEGPSGLGSAATAGQPAAVGGPEEEEEEAPPQVPATALGPPMADLALAGKALSVASVTSQCSYSSTLVHFPHPESEATALEDVLQQGEATDLSPAHAPGVAAATAPTTFATTLEELQPVGLTKEVLSAHTQKEEQNYVDQFHQRRLLSPYQSYFEHGGTGSKPAPSQDQGDFPASWYNCSAPGKFGRQRSPASSKSSSLGSKAVCQKWGAVPAPSSWLPPEGSPPGPSGQSLPAPPSAAPCFPLDSPGGSQAFSWAAPALPSYLPPVAPALPFPCAGHLVAVLVHPVPGGALFPQAFPPGQPQPCFSPAFTCPTGPLGPLAFRSAPNPQRATEPVPLPSVPVLPEEEPPSLFSQSRSSSPLQLNLLQEELPKPPEPPSKAPAKAGAGDTQPGCS